MDERIVKETKAEAARLLEQGQIQTALPLIRQAAHWGDLDSQLLAVDLYLHELYGMPKNPFAAAEYVRLAALNGDVHSMFELADMSARGYGMEKDEVKAFYFMNKAAGLGEAAAFDPLGMMYLTGKGTEKNLQKAIFWLNKALKKEPENETVPKHLYLADKRAGLK